MGERYVNLGAPIRREVDGEMVTVAKRGEVFEPTEEEKLRKAYKLRRVVESGRTQHDSAPAPSSRKPEGDPLDDYALGGGWYLIGGEKFQGREAAAEALQALGG